MMRRIVFVCILIALAAVAIWLGLERMRGSAPPEQVAEPETMKTVTLYFGSKDGSRLAPEYRDIKASDKILENLRQVIEALLSWPAGEVVALFPTAVKVRGVYISEKTAYIDFSRDIVGDFVGGTAGEYLLVASIVQTVCADFPEVDSVGILVEGEEVDTIGGHLNVSRPLRPRDWR